MSSEMILQVGVKIAIIRDHKVLLLKRAADKYKDIKTDRWDIVGGRIEPGTTLLENLKREVMEETQMTIIGQPKLVAAQDILVHRYTDATDNADIIDKHVVRLTFIGEASGEPVLDSDHEEFKWMSRQDLFGLGENLDIYFRELVDKKILELS